MANKTRTLQGIRAHISGGYTTGTLHGKEYMVIPVVALVEGVLQGMAAEGPELVTAEEFGKFPDSWNGRPVVMSHPVVNKSPVSANSPEILEEYQIGFMFNTKVDGNKLITEAWIDTDKAGSLNDNSKETLATLQKGEMIEVSTGYYALLEESEGLHNNEAYQAIQSNIVPDHLAFLPNGTLGACSNKDGCGAQLAVNSKPSDKFEIVKTLYVKQACCDSCAETGGSCKDHPHVHTEGENQAPADPKTYKPLSISNTIAGAITLDDVRKTVQTALRSKLGTDTYIDAMTKDKVVYSSYGYYSGYSGYQNYQLGYSVSADGEVTFSGEPEKVQLLTKIVAVNSGDEPSTTEQDMSTATGAGATAPATNKDMTKDEEKKKQKVENAEGTLEVTFAADGSAESFAFTPKVNATKAPQTVEEYVASAPVAMQEVLQSSIKLHEDKKNGTIKALMDSGRCKFAEESLKAMSLDMLENLVELANVPSYGGRAAPVSANSLNNNADNSPPPAPMVFEVGVKKEAAAA